ncbi:MAG: aminotransferase class V-fold PLP-dependent enzyme [Deltaproteobacteria bacterium]|nr:aminotransferase class V-fold PLP-dependent enzyme [Deltaproteobacteria bacterium]
MYLDYHATTPIDPRVLEAMQPYLTTQFGNSASKTHRFGWVAEEAVEKARAEVASLIGARSTEIVFTSGATESNNLAILGAARSYGLTLADVLLVEALSGAPSVKAPERLARFDPEQRAALEASRRDRLITLATEHKSVLDPMRALAREGFEVSILPVGSSGLLELATLEAAMDRRTLLVSVMAANNEIGVVQPRAQIARIARSLGALFHVDGAQAAAWISLDVEADGIDLLSLSAHKLYGPKGVGALYVRRKNPRVTLEPIIFGGGHERGLRSGTLNVAGIVGFGQAAALALAERADESKRVSGLRDRLLDGLKLALQGVVVHGDLLARLPNNLSVSFEGVEGEALILSLRELALSSGSACTSATPEPSHVLRALGVADELAHGSIRFGLGRGTSEAEIEATIAMVVGAVRAQRAMTG